MHGECPQNLPMANVTIKTIYAIENNNWNPTIEVLKKVLNCAGVRNKSSNQISWIRAERILREFINKKELAIELINQSFLTEVVKQKYITNYIEKMNRFDISM